MDTCCKIQNCTSTVFELRSVTKSRQIKSPFYFGLCPQLDWLFLFVYVNSECGGESGFSYFVLMRSFSFIVPSTVKVICKHTFFLCDRFKKIVLPESLEKMENNPFSGCSKLELENHSKAYYIQDDVIYNGFKNIKVPNSLKINGATCYYVVVEEYIVGGGYPYQYKISFSAKNSFDMTVNDVAYYGYNSEYDSLKSYGSDSTKYSSASSSGKKQDIKV